MRRFQRLAAASLLDSKRVLLSHARRRERHLPFGKGLCVSSLASPVSIDANLFEYEGLESRDACKTQEFAHWSA
jgi:hypothetical protein